MRGNGEEPTAIPPTAANGDLALMYVLAGIGFACLIGWELSMVFAPALPLLEYRNLQEAILLRGASVAALASTLAFCAWKPALVHRRACELLALAFVLSLPAIVCSALQPATTTGHNATTLSWILLGISQGFMMAIWCLFFSRMPTDHTAVTMAWSGCGGTLLFALAGWSGSAPVSLASIVCFSLASAGLAAFLLKKLASKNEPIPRDGARARGVSVPAALSVACHGAIFGYMSIALCSLGEQAAVVGGASGIAGTLLALLWGLLGPRVKLDTSIAHRISLPLIVAGVLLFQIGDGDGKVAAGCLVIAALAHSSIVTWYTTCIENHEYRLEPIRRFALRQFPSWVGFLTGIAIAYLTTSVWSLSDRHYLLFAVTLVVVVVSAYACGGNGAGGIWQRASVTTAPADAAVCERDDIARTTPAPPFRSRCQVVATRYELTPRETEVLVLLAKGRNAEYISSELVVSSSTVKSHIYHIYRKMGINSQQTLINLVESAEVGECEGEPVRA